MNNTFLSPCTGKLYSIDHFPDEIIADRVMGDGFMIELTDNEIVSPFDGIVKVVYPTGHALCLESNDGISMMIHIGVDTFNIQGLNTTYVEVNDRVNKGDLLVKTNVKEMIKKTGNSACAIVFLNNEKVKDLKQDEVSCLDEIAKIEVGND